MNLFLDTNVFLDAILQRPLKDAPLQLLDHCKAGRCSGFTSGISFANVTYFLKAMDKQHARLILTDLLTFINIVELCNADFTAAQALPFTDREDAFQYQAALKAPRIKALITRNVKDYKSSAIPVMTAEQLLKNF